MPKDFKPSKELEALLALLDDENGHSQKLQEVSIKDGHDANVLAEMRAIADAALEVEMANHAAGKKDNTHLPFVKRTTQFILRMTKPTLFNKDVKPLEASEIEKFQNRFENEFIVNKKLRIAGAALLGVLTLAVLAAAALAVMVLLPGAGHVAVAGVAAFLTKLVASLSAVVGTNVGITVGATAGLAVVLSGAVGGLIANVTGNAKQKRLDELRTQITDTHTGEVKSSGSIGTSVAGLFTTLRNAIPARPPVQDQQRQVLANS